MYGYKKDRHVTMCSSRFNHAVSVTSVNILKTRLGKVLSNQEIIYDYHIAVRGTGIRSEVGS